MSQPNNPESPAPSQAAEPSPSAPAGARPSDEAVALADGLEDLSDDQLRQFLEESRIAIKPGGEVVIENLTADLLNVAYALDPDNPGIQCRLDAVAPDDAAAGDAPGAPTPQAAAAAAEGAEPDVPPPVDQP